jgi:hypothetical protein
MYLSHVTLVSCILSSDPVVSPLALASTSASAPVYGKLQLCYLFAPAIPTSMIQMFEVSNSCLRGSAYDFQAFTVLLLHSMHACLSPYFSVPDHSVSISLTTTRIPALFRGLAAWVEDCPLESDTRNPQLFFLCMQASPPTQAAPTARIGTNDRQPTGGFPSFHPNPRARKAPSDPAPFCRTHPVEG